MRFYFCLFILLCSWHVNAQSPLTYREACEDIDYFFAKIDSIHPNMYWHTKPKQIKAFMAEAKRKCKKGTDAETLGGILKSASCFFDYHTGVIGLHGRIWNDNEYLFPLVDIQPQGVFFPDSKKQILTINRLPVGEILKEVRKTFGADLPEGYVTFMQNITPVFQACLGNMGVFSPYRVEISIEGRDSLIVTEGITSDELDEKMIKLIRAFYNIHEPYSLEVYENSALAIIRYNKCVGTDQEEELKAFLQRTFESLRAHRIQYLFIDMSRNPGGSTIPLYQFFPYFDKMKKALPEGLKAAAMPFRGKVFVYQSPCTNSAAPWLGEELRRYDAAILVGTDTEPVINNYSQAQVFVLPHSRLRCRSAENYYTGSYFHCNYNKMGGLVPDIPYPFLTDRLLGETDCLEIIRLERELPANRR